MPCVSEKVNAWYRTLQFFNSFNVLNPLQFWLRFVQNVGGNGSIKEIRFYSPITLKMLSRLVSYKAPGVNTAHHQLHMTLYARVQMFLQHLTFEGAPDDPPLPRQEVSRDPTCARVDLPHIPSPHCVSESTSIINLTFQVTVTSTDKTCWGENGRGYMWQNLSN